MKWETFCDSSYYGLWAVRPVGDGDFSSQKLFHVSSELEAIALKELLETIPESTPSGKGAEEAAQLFDNNSDCYADTWEYNNEKFREGEIVAAMTKETFVKLMTEYANLKCGEKCKCRRCGNSFTDDVIVSDETWLKISPKPIDGYKSGGLLCGQCIADSLQSRIKELEDALRELVKLKDMKTKAEYNSTPSSEKWDLVIEYEKRKPLAWEAARKSIAQSALKK